MRAVRAGRRRAERRESWHAGWQRRWRPCCAPWAPWVALACLAVWRIARHLQEEPEAARALAEHVVIPLLVWKPRRPRPGPNEVEGTVV